MLSRLVIAFLPRSKCLLILWLQSLFAVILEPKKINLSLFPLFPHLFDPEVPVAPGEEHWLLDTSLDEVYWPCSHSRAIPSFPSQTWDFS